MRRHSGITKYDDLVKPCQSPGRRRKMQGLRNIIDKNQYDKWYPEWHGSTSCCPQEIAVDLSLSPIGRTSLRKMLERLGEEHRVALRWRACRRTVTG
jgi:hypothetical protein